MKARDKENPVERAAQSVHIAVADLVIAIQESRSVEEALIVRATIAGLVGALVAAEDSALRRADVLCG